MSVCMMFPVVCLQARSACEHDLCARMVASGGCGQLISRRWSITEWLNFVEGLWIQRIFL